MTDITVIVEHSGGRIRSVSLEVAAFALELRNITGFEVRAVILGDNGIQDLALDFAKSTGIVTTALQTPGYVEYQSDVYLEALTRFFSDHSFSYCLTASSAQGLDIAPALAVATHSACITGVEAVKTVDGTPVFTRSIAGRKLSTDMRADRPAVVLSVQPGMFKLPEEIPAEQYTVNAAVAELSSPGIKSLGIKQVISADSGLTRAKVIISAGRGIGDEENVALLEELKEIFSQSAIGGSRPVCDLGWLRYQQQVGITGTVVTPDLYIACGISGAYQHIYGMQGSGFIVSINSDPNASIFDISDVCIVEDLITFIPLLLDEYRSRNP